MFMLDETQMRIISNVAGKSELWLVIPLYESIMEFLITYSKIPDADFCNQVTNQYRAPVFAMVVVLILIFAQIASLFLGIVEDISVTCE